MDAWCDHTLTDAERLTFETDGYLMLEDVLPDDLINQLEVAADRVGDEERKAREMTPYERLSVMDFIGRDDVFMDLVDYPKVFPKVFGILGWNINIYHSHLVVTPPEEPGNVPDEVRGWHQDSGRVNAEMEFSPRPRLSLKVVYFLTDCSIDGRANFYVVPGTHLEDNFLGNNQRKIDPAGATPVLAPRGSAVIFDRQLWHTATPNASEMTRKGLFYGYSYRWLRPRDNMTVAHYMDRSDPIRQQLLGAAPTGGKGFSSPLDEDVPLRTWMEENLGVGAVV
jgi:ectoine hydroxylase